MADKIYDVVITVTKTVRVRVPDDLVEEDETAEDVAEEFALGGKSSWPDYVISEDVESDVESVEESTS